MSVRDSVVGKLKRFVAEFERQFETKFDAFARDPKFLSFAASGLNLLANSRIQIAGIETEIASFKARVKLRGKANH